MSFDADQLRRWRAASDEADREGASPKERKALALSLLTEAELRNPKGGDRDSVGPLQERSHYGSVRRRRNTRLATRRFIREAKVINRRGHKGSAGNLAQAVQRSAFPERYDQRSKEAEYLLRLRGGSTSTPRPTAGTPPKRVPGTTTTDTKQALRDALMNHDRKGSLLQEAKRRIESGEYTTTTPGKTVKGKAPRSAKGGDNTTQAQSSGFRGSRVLESFHNAPGGRNIDEGKSVPKGFVSGHDRHVHVAAGPKTVAYLAKKAKEMGLHVGEHPDHGGVGGGHAKRSFHYRGQAIDVSGDAKKMAAYSRLVARYNARVTRGR